MKLWLVIQWGNKKDGPDGPDTQCIVAAADMASAINKGELHISHMYNNETYRDGKAHLICLLGDDGRPDGEAQLVVRPWVDVSLNLGHYPSWCRRYWDTNEWVDSESVYGSDTTS